MAHDELIPANVDRRDADFLRRAYALASQEDGDALYREWAATYDRTMVEGLGYISPVVLADALADAVTWRDRPVLDIGCGTGLLGTELSRRGFSVIDGLDLSASMMEEARASGPYRDLSVADLNASLPFDAGRYGAVVCVGTFTSGHVDARCLDELARIVQTGGVLACTVHHVVWEPAGFEAGFRRLVADGALQEMSVTETPFYRSSTGTDGWLCLYRVNQPEA